MSNQSAEVVKEKKKHDAEQICEVKKKKNLILNEYTH